MCYPTHVLWFACLVFPRKGQRGKKIFSWNSFLWCSMSLNFWVLCHQGSHCAMWTPPLSKRAVVGVCDQGVEHTWISCPGDLMPGFSWGQTCCPSHLWSWRKWMQMWNFSFFCELRHCLRCPSVYTLLFVLPLLIEYALAATHTGAALSLSPPFARSLICV